MSKFTFNLNDIHHYEWGNLWWFEYEVSIGFSALSNLINNQEETFRVKLDEFISKRNEVLPTVPLEYRDSYEQHFFEDADRTFNELKTTQRNAICLSFFSYIEGKLMILVKMMETEFKLKYKRAKMDILSSLKRYIVDSCKVDGKVFKKEFRNIHKQSIVRNSLAHNHSHIIDSRKFTGVDGIKLKNDEIIIYDVIYLNNLISWAELFFKELFIAVDKRLTQIKTKP
ncbi:hypothetical protein U8527_04020 [Kordia algicida OT-1]|nr:hypothetical protein [Kordia algicida]